MTCVAASARCAHVALMLSTDRVFPFQSNPRPRPSPRPSPVDYVLCTAATKTAAATWADEMTSPSSTGPRLVAVAGRPRRRCDVHVLPAAANQIGKATTLPRTVKLRPKRRPSHAKSRQALGGPAPPGHPGRAQRASLLGSCGRPLARGPVRLRHLHLENLCRLTTTHPYPPTHTHAHTLTQSQSQVRKAYVC